MNCTVYPDKTYNLIVGSVLLLVLAGLWYAVRKFLHGDIIFQAGLGFIGLVALSTCVVSFFMGKGPWYCVDDEGVYDRRQFKGIVPWRDVLDVERLQRREKQSDGTLFHLREGWRPVVLTIREPEKYLRGIRRWAQSVVPGGAGADATRIRLEFTGLQPLSKEFYHAIEHHLARHEREGRRLGANRA